MNLWMLLIGMPGGYEWVIIGIVVLLLFGAKRIPDLARGLGKGIREFKDATNDIKKEIQDPVDETRKSIDDATKS